jgi:hypothetical protein
MGFGTQTPKPAAVGVIEIAAQRLDGDWAVQFDVVAFPHFSHAALGKALVQAVPMVHQLPWHEPHCEIASSSTVFITGPAVL